MGLLSVRTQLQGQFQRWSNNPKEPAFSDQELFGQLQGFRQFSAIHDYMQQHWLAWFPPLSLLLVFILNIFLA